MNETSHIVSDYDRSQKLLSIAGRLAAKRDWRGAEQCLLQAVAITPENPHVLYELGRAILHHSRRSQAGMKRARGFLRRALRVDSSLEKAHCLLGTIALQQRRMRTAARHWEACLRLDPENLDARRGLRLISMRAERKVGFTLFARILKLLQLG